MVRLLWLSRLLLLCIVLSATATGSTSAQARNHHDGFWFGFGAGGGHKTPSPSSDGFTFYGRLGGTLSPKLLVGGELLAWVGRNENPVGYITRMNQTGVVLVYPSTAGGFFLKGGAGLAWLEVPSGRYDTSTYESSLGFGTTIGIGYDLRLGRVHLTPGFDVMIQSIRTGEVTITLDPITDNATVWLVSLGLTRH